MNYEMDDYFKNRIEYEQRLKRLIALSIGGAALCGALLLLNPDRIFKYDNRGLLDKIRDIDAPTVVIDKKGGEIVETHDAFEPDFNKRMSVEAYDFVKEGMFYYQRMNGSRISLEERTEISDRVDINHDGVISIGEAKAYRNSEHELFREYITRKDTHRKRRLMEQIKREFPD